MGKLSADGFEIRGVCRDDGPRKVLLFECWQELYEPVESVDGATVGTLLAILRGDVDFFARLFDAPHLEEYLDEPAKPAKEDPRPLRYVDFRMYMEKWNGKHWHKDGEISMYPDASGVGLPDCHMEGIDPDKDVHYAIDFTPLPSLASLPIVVSDEVELIEYTSKKAGMKRTLLGRMPMRLIDVLHALVEEASFHGSPESRDGRMDDIKERVKECMDDLKELGLDDDDEDEKEDEKA
jgi:hypothetical protein